MGRDDHVLQCPERRVGGQLHLQELGAAHDGGEHVVEVVRHAAGQGPDGFHFLRLAQLVFQGQFIGDVPGNADDGAFGERSIDHPLVAVAFDETVGGAKDAAVDADIFTQYDDTVIFLHFLLQGQVEGLNHGHLSHCSPPHSARPSPSQIPFAVPVKRGTSRHTQSQTYT